MRNIFNHILVINILLLAKTQPNHAFLPSVNHPKAIKPLRPIQSILMAKQETTHLHVNESHAAPPSVAHIIRRLNGYLSSPENKALVFAAATFSGLGIGLNLLSPFLLSQIIQMLSNSDTEFTIKGIKINQKTMMFLCVLCYASSHLIVNIRDQVMTAITCNVSQKILREVMEKILRRSLHYHITNLDAEKVYLIQKGHFIARVGPSALIQTLPIFLEIVLISSWIFMKYDKRLSLLILTAFLLNVISAVISSKAIVYSRAKLLQCDNGAWNHFIGAISQYKITHDFGHLDRTLKETDSYLDNLRVAETRANILSLDLELVQQCFSAMSLLIVVFYVGTNIQSKKFKVQDFVLIVNYFIQLLSYMPLFSRSINQFVAAYPGLNFVFRELDKPHEVIDTYPNRPLYLTNGSGPTIEFIDVDFSYPNSTVPIFNKLSFKVKPNQRVAFVSESGMGKTTIFNLLYRHYVPNNGTIKINDQDISTVSLDSLRKAISICEQTPTLSKGTVRKNICFGAENPELITDEYIYAISQSVGLERFLKELPFQLDTEVGEGGRSLSGGQQQKVAILRGLLKNTTVRLFDEITASLDGPAANQILKDLNWVLNGTTSLMISHKISEVRHADHIFVLDKGRVVAQGTHEQLVLSSQLYQKLWRASLRKLSNSPYTLFSPNADNSILNRSEQENLSEDDDAPWRVDEHPANLKK
ncbi:MAG: ABC transporter ATP-binding protein [Bacteroidetes bacterium]|nr:ABC transporter ATP-binding protein [Bacteroidota bacterium]